MQQSRFRAPPPNLCSAAQSRTAATLFCPSLLPAAPARVPRERAQSAGRRCLRTWSDVPLARHTRRWARVRGRRSKAQESCGCGTCWTSAKAQAIVASSATGASVGTRALTRVVTAPGRGRERGRRLHAGPTCARGLGRRRGAHDPAAGQLYRHKRCARLSAACSAPLRSVCGSVRQQQQLSSQQSTLSLALPGGHAQRLSSALPPRRCAAWGLVHGCEAELQHLLP